MSGCRIGSITIWDAVTRMKIWSLRGHDNLVRSVAFSPDGSRIVSGSWDKTIRLWDAATGQQIGKPLIGHRDYVTSVAFSPDGTCLVSGSDDKSIRIWDTLTGEQIGEALLAHTSRVWSVVFSPDCQKLVSGSIDGTTRIWDIDYECVHFIHYKVLTCSLISTQLCITIATATCDPVYSSFTFIALLSIFFITLLRISLCETCLYPTTKLFTRITPIPRSAKA